MIKIQPEIIDFLKKRRKQQEKEQEDNRPRLEIPVYNPTEDRIDNEENISTGHGPDNYSL